MCGGNLETILCSHVGHIYRNSERYKGLKYNVRNVANISNIIKKNLIRLSEVWMDEYSKYYYERIGYDLVSGCIHLPPSLLCLCIRILASVLLGQYM